MSFTDATGNHYLAFELKLSHRYKTGETQHEELIEAEWDLRKKLEIQKKNIVNWLILYCGSENFRNRDYKPLLEFLGEKDERFTKYLVGEYHVVSAKLVRRRDQDLIDILRQTDEYKEAKALNDKALERLQKGV